MSIVLRYFGRLPRAALRVLLVGLLAIGGAATAGAIAAPRERIVALGFDADSNTLIKAYPKAIYRRGSGGRDWESVALPKAVARGRIVSLAVSAQSPRVLYVAGRGFGVVRSADGGRTWNAINHGLPSNDIAALSAHADRPNTLYAVVTGRGIFRSEDAGGHWRLMDAGPRDKIVDLVHSNMPGSMQTGWFFAATTSGVGRSMDCFCGWRDAGGLRRAVIGVTYDPQQPKQIYAATEDSLFFSVDGGEQWSRARAPGGNITALVATPTQTLYAAVGEGELFRSGDRGMTWHHLDE